ncbi:MAG TPA: NINE protein [Silvibacterium sp.]|nr:NINE protein [Silvibacterium sp.]
MTVATAAMTAGWTDQQRAFFQAQMSAWQKDEVVGVLLALFLGTFGAHHFYLRKTGLGILYIVFCWTGVPTIISIVECFFMPGRVRQYNLALATYFASQISSVPAAAVTPISGGIVTTQSCPNCGNPVPMGANFCARCGAKIAG